MTEIASFEQMLVRVNNDGGGETGPLSEQQNVNWGDGISVICVVTSVCIITYTSVPDARDPPIQLNCLKVYNTHNKLTNKQTIVLHHRYHNEKMCNYFICRFNVFTCKQKESGAPGRKSSQTRACGLICDSLGDHYVDEMEILFSLHELNYAAIQKPPMKFISFQESCCSVIQNVLRHFAEHTIWKGFHQQQHKQQQQQQNKLIH